MKGIPVLMYHAVETADIPAGYQRAGEQLYVLQVEQFNEQMAYLQREGFTTCLLSELLALDKWPEKGIMLTFDDGHASNLTISLPILRHYGFKAEFFITTSWLGTPGYLKGKEVKALYDAGMGIGSHGSTHTFFEELDDEGIERELRDSMDVLTRLTGDRVLSLSAPGGRVKPGVAAIARRLGYEAVFTSRPGVLSATEGRFSVPRLPLQCGTDIAQFASMAQGDQKYLHKMARRYDRLKIAKMMLGEKGYQLLRKMLLEIS
jgi:peptidoglycan/xylan/chitin deacetylase (PgdA/CDA1 family)